LAGQRVLVGIDTGDIVAVDASAGTATVALAKAYPAGGWLWCMAVSPDGKLLAVSDEKAKCVRLYDVASMSLRSTIQCAGLAPYRLCFPADGSRLVTSHDKCAKLWNVADGSHVRDFSGHAGYVRVPGFSPDMTVLATPSEDKTIRLWNVSSGATVHTLTGHTDFVFSVVFAAQGRQLLSISGDRTLRAWDVASGKQLREIRLPASGYTLCLSDDGLSVFSGGGGGALQQWRLSDGHEMRKFDGHTANVIQLRLSRDGSVLVSASFDGTVRFWRVADGALLRTVPLGGEARALCLA
jgi:WD40 repeat protein